jgi:multidrug resistance efflux pump
MILAGALACKPYKPQPTRAVHAEGTEPAPGGAGGTRAVRATGTVQPVRFFTLLTPQITGQPGRLTLIKIVSNGIKVNQGDILAEFDRTQQEDNAREAQAKLEDLGHQVEQRQAQNRSDATKRTADLKRAEADLAKAEIQIRKGPLLTEIERLKVETRLADAQARVASLNRSNELHDRADAAALRILELQRDRQKVSLDRATANSAKLQIRAPLAGMVALMNVYKSNTFAPPQDGDQLYPGQSLLRIFDPGDMNVQISVGEPDGAVLVPGSRAQVRLDAYPALEFQARFESASPVAASALGSPIKTFTAQYRLEQRDPHLLPDLSAAVIIQVPPGAMK